MNSKKKHMTDGRLYNTEHLEKFVLSSIYLFKQPNIIALIIERANVEENMANKNPLKILRDCLHG
jgi:hypothetical protein